MVYADDVTHIVTGSRHQPPTRRGFDEREQAMRRRRLH